MSITKHFFVCFYSDNLTDAEFFFKANTDIKC